MRKMIYSMKAEEKVSEIASYVYSIHPPIQWPKPYHLTHPTLIPFQFYNFLLDYT